ncbi:MAG TPA: DUF2470 domain-containing protein [Nocardioidaceae bacterium]|nr:DUF2470 domain-containing protein [Nocardioidaceae bacterium]
MSPIRALDGSRQQRRALAPAERARTLVAGAVDLRFGVLNMTHEVHRHAVGSDGSLLFLAPADSPGSVFRMAPRLPAQVVTVTAVDVASVPHHDRIRGSLRLTGPIRPVTEPLPAGIHTHLAGPDPPDYDLGDPVLRLQPNRVSISWHCENGGEGGFDSQGIPVEEYRDAFPDPLMELEAHWLPHLHRGHPALLRTLAAHACGDLDDSVEVRPLALDRFGLVLRLYGDGKHRDTRLLFGRPVACGCELRDAVNDLLDRAGPAAP